MHQGKVGAQFSYTLVDAFSFIKQIGWPLFCRIKLQGQQLCAFLAWIGQLLWWINLTALLALKPSPTERERETCGGWTEGEILAACRTSSGKSECTGAKSEGQAIISNALKLSFIDCFTQHCNCLYDTIRHGNERLSNSLKIAWPGRSLCNDHSGVPIFPQTEASIFFDVSHQSSQSSLSLPQALPTTLFISNVYKVSSFSCWSLIVAWPCFLSCTYC